MSDFKLPKNGCHAHMTFLEDCQDCQDRHPKKSESIEGLKAKILDEGVLPRRKGLVDELEMLSYKRGFKEAEQHYKQELQALEALYNQRMEKERKEDAMGRYCAVCYKPCRNDGGWMCEEHGYKSLYISRMEAADLRTLLATRAGINKKDDGDEYIP